MKLKKRVLIILMFSLLILSCKVEKLVVEETVKEETIKEEIIKEPIIDPKAELVRLLKKAQTFPNVMIGLKETTIGNNFTQIKTTNLSYKNDSIKVLTNLQVKEVKDGVKYTIVNDWGLEVVKDTFYTQCLLDIDVWLCDEIDISAEQFTELLDEIKDKNFIEQLERVEKKEDCYLINNNLLDCYDENGFLTSMKTNSSSVERIYLKFEQDNFQIPDNSEYVQ